MICDRCFQEQLSPLFWDCLRSPPFVPHEFWIPPETDRTSIQVTGFLERSAHPDQAIGSEIKKLMHEADREVIGSLLALCWNVPSGSIKMLVMLVGCSHDLELRSVSAIDMI